MDRVHSIRIPVHGFVEFSEWERDIINHPVFQRLRRIRQLAFSEHLYPGSVHTRFEHSLGVMHVATRLYDAVSERFGAIIEHHLGYDPMKARARTLVRLGALLHDVGHSPFSHSGEDLMPDTLHHEDYSAELIRCEMLDVIDNHPANKIQHRVTGEEIAAFYQKQSTISRKLLFWRELVAGQLDADRMDYLLRDSFHCGVAYGSFDLGRLIDTICLVSDPDEDSEESLRIGIEEGGRHAAEGQILARYFMFTQVYFHPVRKAYDHHASEILREMLEVNGYQGRLPDPRTPDGRKKFLALDDWSVMAFMKNCDNNRHARALMWHHHDRCVHRTPEVPKPADLAHFDRVVATLRREGIEVWVGDAGKDWYKSGSGEVMISREDSDPLRPSPAKPLSVVSDVVGKIADSKQRLAFVPHDQTKAAEEILRTRKDG